MFQLQLLFTPLWRMGPNCSSAETPVCHRSYIIAARVRVALSLVFCVMFYRSSLVLLFSFFWPLCCLSPSSFYGFWLTIWYPKTFINPAKFYWSASPTPWKWEVMYLWVRGIDFAPFCWILELVRQCGIFHFSFYYCWCCIC